MNTACPCCSGKQFHECCEPFLKGAALPKNPEQLMRSRYSAYSQANVDYIADTMLPPAAFGFEKNKARQWAQSVKWEGLKVIAASQQGSSGKVEFIASYSENNKLHQMHEISDFKCINGRWFYTDGTRFEGRSP